MLPPEKLEQYEKRIAKIYDDLSIKIIQDIADRITSFDFAKGVVSHNIDLLQQMGYSYDNILRLVAEANNMTFVEVQDIFFDAGLSTLYSDDAIYKRAGMNPVPLNKSPAMLNLIRGTIARTNGMFENLTSTIANNTQTLLYNTLNKAYMEVSSGYKSYSQSIISAIKEIAQQSSIVTYPSGHRDTIEVAVRRAVITSVNQTCGKIQKLRANEMKWDLMVLTAHYNARPSHAEWQGRVVSLSGKKGYLSLDDIGYGTIEGFQGINCRHSWFPYFEGSSLPYTEEELERYKNNTVKYNGEDMKGYEAAQKQRYLERKIRQDKKEIAGLEQVLTSDNKDATMLEEVKKELQDKKNKLNIDNAKLDDFIKQTGNTKDYSRLYVKREESSKKLNEDEIYALNSYISSESYKINDILRNNRKLSSEQKNIIHNLDSALSKCEKYKGNIVRVLDIRNGEDLKHFILQNQIGKKTSCKEYLSFSNKNNYNENANVIIYVTSKCGRDIRKYNPEENEILYPRNSKFFVENVLKKDNKYYILWRDVNG